MITWARKYSEMRYLAEPLHSPPGYEQFPIITKPYVAEALRKPSPPSPPLPPSESVSTSGPAVSRPERAKH